MAVATKSAFRLELEQAVLERHCANHPMTEKWARGELGRRALMGWAVEHWHWIKKMPAATFYRCAQAPEDVRQAEVANGMEEDDPPHSHKDIVLRFAAANGANLNEVGGHPLRARKRQDAVVLLRRHLLALRTGLRPALASGGSTRTESPYYLRRWTYTRCWPTATVASSAACI